MKKANIGKIVSASKKRKGPSSLEGPKERGSQKARNRKPEKRFYDAPGM